jgi:Na+-translocating ferredoxin:NAD+ oxidoreductase RnfG subunit
MTTRTRALWLMPAALAALPAYHAARATVYMSVDEAQHAAFSKASAFTPVAVSPADLDAALKASPESAMGGAWSPKVWEARDGDAIAGWFFVDQVIGKAEAITFAVALDAHGAVQDIEILEYRETHGGEVRLAPWRKQFNGKTAHDPIRLDVDIRNISGATLSCRHVTDGVRRLVALHDHALKAASG